jgi:hypothetical protein
MHDAGYLLIPVYGRDGIVAQCKVDKDDFEHLSQFRWGLRGGNVKYVSRWVRRTNGRDGTLMMHRYLLGLDDGKAPRPPRSMTGHGAEVDHINRDPFDNRRSNLRILERPGNAQNSGARGGSSQLRGVSWDKARGKWRAFYAGRYLGQYATEAEAAEVAAAYRRAHAPFSTD